MVKRFRRWVDLIFGLVPLLAVLVIPSCGNEDTASADQVALATELADTWARGWDENDPELVGSVLTEDATYFDDVGFTGGRLWTKDEHVDEVQKRGALITEVQRVIDLERVGDNTFSFDEEFNAHGNRYRGSVEIELEGDLISRCEWLSLGQIES